MKEHDVRNGGEVPRTNQRRLKVLTILVAAILLLMVVYLLMQIPLVREFASAFFCSVVTLLIIQHHGGDLEFWTPWVLGIWFGSALLKLIYGLFGIDARSKAEDRPAAPVIRRPIRPT
jgi:hypothetical protein